ncbi:hypothetical protein [Kordia sp.]|uniref:hypothetical protein n=1 Tax=Kordia sp. TaxID=1965332 RepID=UPI0025C215B8|nr:hypothetical protein [Kordia sp.]MCH2195544.1 hypothetical protein [Kordia sp.]
MMRKTGILLLLLTLIAACTNYGEKKVFDGTEIYYKDGVTEVEADKLGESLMDSGFTNGELKSVQFLKEGDKYIFKMVVKEQFLEDNSLSHVFKFFPREISEYMDLSIDLHLCDSHFNTLQIHTLQDAHKSIMAKATEIRYTNKVVPHDVEKLKDYLIENGFADDEIKKVVVLDRENMNYIFKLVIDKRRLEHEGTLSLLTLLKGQLSKNVFSGLPVKIHMCDDLMNTLKEI